MFKIVLKKITQYLWLIKWILKVAFVSVFVFTGYKEGFTKPNQILFMIVFAIVFSGWVVHNINGNNCELVMDAG